MPGSQPRGFSLHIYLPEGTADGLRMVEKSNWIGLGLACSRAVFPEAKQREEFGRTGVYVLIGPSGEGETAYVGQADPIRSRLERHYADEDFWTWMVAFVSKDDSLNRAHALHLEARLVQRAEEARRATLANRSRPGEPGLSERERDDMESFLADILSILPVLGVNVFEPAPARSTTGHLLSLTGRGIVARGYDSPQGFVVTAGSQASVEESEVAVAWLSARRADLITRDALADRGEYLEFMQDCVFPSPSTAGGVVLGREVNGRTAWKDEQSRTLREIQEAESVG